MDAAINWTLPWRRTSKSVFFELRPGKRLKSHPSSRCRRRRTHILASLDQQAGSHSGTAALWEEADETAGKGVQRRSEKGKISLETLRCRQRSTLGKRNAHEERQNRGCSGSTELAIVVSRRSRREISLWKAGDKHKERKEEQKERKAGGHCGLWAAIRASGVAPMAWKNECLRDRV